MKNYNKHIFAFSAGIISLIIYILTLNPTVTFMDSGELAAVCTTFGIPHPTGYPLFLVLGYIFSVLPFSSSPVYNLNLMSALFSSASVVIFYYASYLFINILAAGKSKHEPKHTLKHAQKHKKSKEPVKEKAKDISFSENVIIVTAFFSSLVLGFSKTFWANAVSVEVYSLHAMMLVILLYFCIKIYSTLKEQNKKNWVMLFVFLGLSFANHMTTVFILPAIIYIFYLQYKENPAYARKIYPLVFWSVPGLLLYLVLMFRASSEPFLNWSDPKTLSNLIHHITGGDFSQLMFSSSSVFSKNAKLFFSTVMGEFAVISGIISLVGLIYIYFRSKHLFYILFISIIGCLLYSLNYNIRDLLSYFFLIYILLALSFGAGLIYVLNIFVSKVYLKVNFAIIVIIAGLLLSGFTFISNFEANNNSENFVIEDLTLNTINQLEPNAILMTYDWGYVYPSSLYYQQIQKLRGDVKIFNVKFLSVSWYLNVIKKFYPDVYENCKEDFDSYISSGAGGNPAKLNNLVKAFIAKNYNKFPFYMTYDFIYAKEIRPLINNYLIQPDGLVYRLKNANAEYDSTAGSKSLQFKFRKFVPNTTEKEKVYISIAGVYYDNAEFHFKRNNPAASLKFLDKALEINPNFKEAAALKNQILQGRTK